MSKDILTVGHYASHLNTGGYQPLKTNKSEAQHPPSSESGVALPPPPEFFHNISIPLPQLSDIEVRIRREVLDDLDKMIACESDGEEYYKSILLRIKDRLNLLWGSNE